MLDLQENKEAIERVREIDKQIHEENQSDNRNGKKVTKLMFEQMLRGLYLGNISQD